MRKTGKIILRVIQAAVLFYVANLVTMMQLYYSIPLLVIGILWFLFINFIPTLFHGNIRTISLRNSADGCELLRLFLLSTAAAIFYSIFGWFGLLPLPPITQAPAMWIGNTLVIFLMEFILFWNGIIRIYVTSRQLGIRWRVIGALCGLIPVVHVVVLSMMIYIVEKEVRTENGKLVLEEKRTMERICATKYPILLVHGVFFRDSNYFNYWGRIPETLQKNGAIIFYGNHQSAASVADSGQELADRIREIVRQYDCGKVNIIAHSKGGLDCRYAISELGIAELAASLTTINTPHRGCEFADYLLSKIPEKQQQVIANGYNAALKRLGDVNPDFLAAVYDLTAEKCQKLNETINDMPQVYYQSVGSKQNTALSGRFPLNFSYQLVHYFDGENDGLVGAKSFPWGDDYQLLTVTGNRGISHGDMIDLNRENLDEFDVREFYVQLVSGLKKRGL